MMKCPQCGKTGLLVEGLGDGKTKILCQSCGYMAIRDERGRGLLTDDKPQPDQRRVIMG